MTFEVSSLIVFAVVFMPALVLYMWVVHRLLIVPIERMLARRHEKAIDAISMEVSDETNHPRQSKHPGQQ